MLVDLAFLIDPGHRARGQGTTFLKLFHARLHAIVGRFSPVRRRSSAVLLFWGCRGLTQRFCFVPFGDEPRLRVSVKRYGPNSQELGGTFQAGGEGATDFYSGVFGIKEDHSGDVDGDGVENLSDLFPITPSDFADLDGDGLGNNADEIKSLGLMRNVKFKIDPSPSENDVSSTDEL